MEAPSLNNNSLDPDTLLKFATEFKEAKTALATKEQAMSELQRSEQTFRNENIVLIEEITTLRHANAELRKLVDGNSDVQKLRQENEALRKRAQNLEDQMAEIRKQAQENENKIIQQNMRIYELSQEKNEAKNRLEKLEKIQEEMAKLTNLKPNLQNALETITRVTDVVQGLDNIGERRPLINAPRNGNKDEFHNPDYPPSGHIEPANLENQTSTRATGGSSEGPSASPTSQLAEYLMNDETRDDRDDSFKLELPASTNDLGSGQKKVKTATKRKCNKSQSEKRPGGRLRLSEASSAARGRKPGPSSAKKMKTVTERQFTGPNGELQAQKHGTSTEFLEADPNLEASRSPPDTPTRPKSANPEKLLSQNSMNEIFRRTQSNERDVKKRSRSMAPLVYKSSQNAETEKSEEKTKRVHKKKEFFQNDSPKYPKSAYSFWQQENSDYLKSLMSGRKGSYSRIVSNEWWNVEDKSKWEALAAEDKRRYEEELKAYEVQEQTTSTAASTSMT